nr:hypothetical protein [uncultured Glaciecola sp.]
MPLELASEPLSVQVDPNETSRSSVGTETSISSVYKEFRESDILNNKSNKSNKSRLKTLDETRAKVERFVAIFGDMDIKFVTQKDIAKYRDTLLMCARNEQNHRKYSYIQ